MKFWEIVAIILGVIVLVWGLSTLNTFVGGAELFFYVGSLSALGIFVIIGGWFFLVYAKANAGIKDHW
jgi:hypothetical protein